MEDVAPPKGK